MSQAPTLPPPPIVPRSSGRWFRLGIFGLAVLAVLLGIELHFLNSATAKETAHKIGESSFVRAEFGDDVHVVYAVAWGWSDKVQIYARLSGSRTHGKAYIELEEVAGKWIVSRLDIISNNTGHLINLAPPPPTATREQLQAVQKLHPRTLYLVALGQAAVNDVNDLQTFFESNFGIPAKTLRPMMLPDFAYDPHRRQWISELLIQEMKDKFPELAANPSARIVGILDDDLYIREYGWAYTYSSREEDKYSVVPTSRIDPAGVGLLPSPDVRADRLHKVAMKAVGLLYLGFKESADPRSVDAIEYTTKSIDAMEGAYLASDIATGDYGQRHSGKPCFFFSSANVSGGPLLEPIIPCGAVNYPNTGVFYSLDLSRQRLDVTTDDLVRSGLPQLYVQRNTESVKFDDKVRSFGRNAWDNLDDTVWSMDPNSIQTINIFGSEFHRLTPGNGFSPSAKYRAGPNNGGFSYALLSWDNGGWKVDTWNGEVWRYLGCSPNSRVQCYFMSYRTPAGDMILVTRDQSTGHIQQVAQKTNPSLTAAAALDHTLKFSYDGETVVQIDDSDGQSVHYRYDANEYLTDVDVEGRHTHYDYDESHRLTGVNEDGRPMTIHYDSEFRPDRFQLPSATYSIHYSVEAIDVSTPNGNYRVTMQPTYFQVTPE